MGSGVFSLVPEERIREILSNLQAFTDLAIQLVFYAAQKSRYLCSGARRSLCFLLPCKFESYRLSPDFGSEITWQCHYRTFSDGPSGQHGD